MKLTVYCEPVAMTALTTQKTPPNNHSDGAHYCSADGQGEEPDPQNNDDHQKYCFDLETPFPQCVHVRFQRTTTRTRMQPRGARRRSSLSAEVVRRSPGAFVGCARTERHYCEGCNHVLERATASEQGDSC